MNMVAEGVKSSGHPVDIAPSTDVEMPIIEHVVKVVHEGMDPRRWSLAHGPHPKSEFHGLEMAMS
jgi:glycerol-3-phosphate dehydrogenase (NAD(P)+)